MLVWSWSMIFFVFSRNPSIWQMIGLQIYKDSSSGYGWQRPSLLYHYYHYHFSQNVVKCYFANITCKKKNAFFLAYDWIIEIIQFLPYSLSSGEDSLAKWEAYLPLVNKHHNLCAPDLWGSIVNGSTQNLAMVGSLQFLLLDLLGIFHIFYRSFLTLWAAWI